MRPKYNGIKLYSINDLAFSSCFNMALGLLNSFENNKQYESINEIIELYNVSQIFSTKGIKEEFLLIYKTKEKDILRTIACYIKSLDEKTFLYEYHKVSSDYLDEFWVLIEKYKVFTNIPVSVMREILYEPDFSLYLLLRNKTIVKHFDKLIADYMMDSDQSAELIIQKFLELKETNGSIYYFPNSLNPKDYESILDKYIDSEQPHLGYLMLLSSSQSSAECPISDELRLKAKRKADEKWKERTSSGMSFCVGVDICFGKSEKTITIDNANPHQMKFTYNENWIKENLDYPTLLNNFIYLFGFVDSQFRCSFPSLQNQLDCFERHLGVKGRKEYRIGLAFKIQQMKSTGEMNGYYDFLSRLGVYIEDIFQWFFVDYLKREFNCDGFVINMPSNESSFLEKCKCLPTEMDGILKQFSLFVKYHRIDRELLEMSSNPVVFKDLPSMMHNKYAYANSNEIETEQFDFFSDQSVLRLIKKHGERFHNFYSLLLSTPVNISDFPEWHHPKLRWLEKRTDIYIDSTGMIHLNKPRILLLYDLFEHEVVCPYYYEDQSEIEKLSSLGEIRFESKLFSSPEQKYLNYLLNKSEFSNGLDLRNKYIHSTYPLDINQHKIDYITMLKVLAIIIIKINEEFCIRYPITESNNQVSYT